MVSALWHHGPSMVDQMHRKSIAWPHFDAREMSNLIAYLDSRMEESRVPEREDRPILVLLASHWISMLGAFLVTLAGISWLFALPLNFRGHVGNPYIGLLLFVALPIVFFVGLALIPVGIILAKRQVAASIREEQERNAWRRTGIFLAVMTGANVIIGSQVSYRAVQEMDTVQFCGQSCHVMKPEFTAHQLAPHRVVECVDCHVAPGASGWVQSKINGTRQLKDVIFNTYPRPIESAMESNRLPTSAETCEQCHDAERFIGSRLRILTEYNSDESNTRTETVLMMMVGGGRYGGIHGVHMGPGVHMRYAASDKQRQTIPWVEYRVAGASVMRTYLASTASATAIRDLPMFDMQCVDCHNRTAHAFELPDHAVDDAIAAGRISGGLPFVKKTGVELIKAAYRSNEEARQKIPAGLTAFYEQNYAEAYRKQSADIQAAGQALSAIYDQNVFPELKVTWGTYPNNLGHMDFPGCFRCHDGDHATADKKTIPQDCSVCHQMLAVDEKSPEILKTLGAANQ
jgi:NapC/NirT cytochrome c family protein